MIEVFGGMDNHENNVQCGNGQSVIGGDELTQKEAGWQMKFGGRIVNSSNFDLFE